MDKLGKKAVVPKEFKQSKEGGIRRSRRPIGLLLYADIANQGFFYLTEVAYRGFPPLNCRGFLPVNIQVFPPVTE